VAHENLCDAVRARVLEDGADGIPAVENVHAGLLRARQQDVPVERRVIVGREIRLIHVHREQLAVKSVDVAAAACKQRRGVCRDFAHIGVIQVMEEHGLEVDVIAGSSMGGLASTWFASERCDLFGCAIVQSGGFPGMPIVVPAGLPLRFYLDVGLLEDRLLDSTRALRDDLRGKGYEVAYQEYPGGHDFFWWGETIADGLVALLG